MDENYQLTKTDLCLIAYSMNIPIVVILQSSNQQIKLISFHNKQNSYFVRPSRNMFFINSFNKDILIKHTSLSTKLQESLMNYYSDFEDYLLTDK
jgi:hypothetical protein